MDFIKSNPILIVGIALKAVQYSIALIQAAGFNPTWLAKVKLGIDDIVPNLPLTPFKTTNPVVK